MKQISYHLRMTTNIEKFWPFPDKQIRVSQSKAFDWLEQNLDKKYLLCEVPVGAGKSNIGVTFSRYLSGKDGSSYILTPQRILQEQYERSFDRSYLASLYGQSNYQCERGNKMTCDIGNVLKPRCFSCPHKIARQIAVGSPNTVLNYTLALLSFTYTNTFARRKLMVLDECHTLESHLTEFSAVEISARRCERYKIPFVRSQNIKDALEWIEVRYEPVLERAFKALETTVLEIQDSGHSPTPTEIAIIREFNGLAEHLETLQTISMSNIAYVQAKYVLVHDANMIKFKPLTGADNFVSILNPMAEKFLFMSSTILNYKAYCKDLGIDQNQTAFLSLGSEFPAENRPVYFLPTTKMNAAWNNPENEAGRTKLSKTLREIIELHKEDSGIIHTGNFAIAKWLTEELKDITTHEIFHHNPGSKDNRNVVIKGFQQSKKPSILISPSITEGLDLVEDLARFAIFAKVPFGNLGDQWIKARLDLSNEWYQRHAVINIIQGGGRVVRSKDDWGEVYILDSSWSYLLSQTVRSIPDWWLEAYHD